MNFIAMYNQEGTLIEKVMSDVYPVNDCLTIRVQTTLNKKSSKGKALPRTSIKEYNSKKYIDQSKLASIQNSREDYLTFVFFNQNTNSVEEILSSYDNIFAIKDLFFEAALWFTKQRIDKVFATDKRGILTVQTDTDRRLIAQGLVKNNAIAIEPCVLTDGITYQPGAKLFYNDESKFIYLTDWDVRSINDYLEHFNLYEECMLLSIMARQISFLE